MNGARSHSKHADFCVFLGRMALLLFCLSLSQPVIGNPLVGGSGSRDFSLERPPPLKLSPNARGTFRYEEKLLFGRQRSEANATISIDQPASCPSINATVPTTTTSGPNGSIFFLTCGINATDPYNGGWKPPAIRVDQLVITADFSSAQAVDASIFKPCAPYYDNFRNASTAIGVSPVLLAAFAMQESACNPRALGSGGTAGLLQLSPDKCLNADCYDAATNINIGARYLKSLLDADPNILLAVGSWNGWYKGMTFADATSAQGGNCYSQQNLDYLQQYFNGWLQNVNGYGQPGVNDRLGFYFNLDVCAPRPFPTWGVSPGSTIQAPIYYSSLLFSIAYLVLELLW